MLNIKHEIPFVKDMMETTQSMWQLGWNERNGGNISYMLDENMVLQYINTTSINKTIDIGFEVKDLAGKYFIVTASGSFFRNIAKYPEKLLGVIRIQENGNKADVLWGFENGNRPTSELASHLMSHSVRLKKDPTHRVVLHCHATNIVAMSHAHSLVEEEFTRTIWQMCTECLYVFPEGVGVLPWLVPGTNEIGIQTAKKMQDCRLVLWPQHGIFGTGRDLDDAFSLVEVLEKAAQVYMLQAAIPDSKKQYIADKDLYEFAKVFKVIPRDGVLKM
ncbi:MAG: rhamnulose-1-phosphate aldolase [Alphaproteobacteria bacterium]|jgi:rhamnulose-1-phosphate aldolase|nr:rhamnulose-1-phosphate aldolase [Alphaproteobacteria bacterium]